MKLRTPAPRPSVTLLPAVRLLAAGLAATVLAACGGKQDAASTGTAAAGEEKVLNVYNYSDYIAEDTIPNFEKQTGIKVSYTEDVDDNDTYFNKIAPQLRAKQDINRDIIWACAEGTGWTLNGNVSLSDAWSCVRLKPLA